MRRYLVVANQTLGSARLAETIRECMSREPSTFHVVVPATRPHDQLIWTEGEAHAIARDRLKQGMEWMRSLGAEVTGSVGDTRPMLAVEDALIADSYDEIIISTLPPGLSRWLRQDLPARIRHKFGLPVSHVEGEVPHAARTA